MLSLGTQYEPVKCNESYMGNVTSKLPDYLANLTQFLETSETKLDSTLISEFFTLLAEKSRYVFWLAGVGQQQLYYVSPTYEHIWGRSCQSLYDNPDSWLECVHPEDRERVEKSLTARDMTAKAVTQYGEWYRIIRSDGEVRWIKDSCFTLHNDKGDCVGLAGITEDVTYTKLREQALIDAKEKAEAANRAKSEFLAMVSHELRLPLTAILGMAQLLSLDCLLPVQHEQVKDIVEASERLLGVIDDLLDLSKLEAGKMELQLASLDLRKLLEEIATMLTFQAKSKGLELLVSYDEDAPYLVLGDARAIRQIVLDLVDNALKFTEQGYILIRVRCQEQTAQQAHLVLSIEDTGVGIAADKLQIIFERFNQGDTSYRRRYDGAGLGLTISKAYTELMGGIMMVESQAGKGSIFSCHIPFTLQQLSNSLISPWELYRSTVKVLIVDDTLRGEVLRKHIASSVTEVITGKDVLSHLMAAERRSQPYDVVIIDQQLKSADAMVLGQKINNQTGLHTPMLLLLIASGAPAGKEASKVAGYFATIVKPVQPTELLTALTAAWEIWAEKNRSPLKQADLKQAKQLVRVLLVEDDKIVQKVHKVMLERLGCEVDVAENSFCALDLFSRGYDIVLLDIGLPGVSGLEVATEIRKREGTSKHTPIIAITAFGQEEDKKNCLAVGIDEVAIKPLSFESFQHILFRCIPNKDKAA